MLKELLRIFSNKKNILYFFLIYFFIFFLFRIYPDFILYFEILNSKYFSGELFWNFFWKKTILSFSFQLFWDSFVVISVPFLISLNIILFKELYYKHKVFLKGKSFFALLSGMFLGFFGVGCFACSGLIFASLISALGLSAFFDILPYQGREVSFLGIFILLISSIYILKKIKNPIVCT